MGILTVVAGMFRRTKRNKRQRRSYMIAAVLALSLVFSTSGRVDAALITFDLRLAGSGGKSAMPTHGVPSVLSLELYAVIANADGNRANDAFQAVHASLISTETSTSWQGNFAPIILSPLLDSAVSQQGTPKNLDANPDLELGGLNPELPDDWIILHTGSSAKFGTGMGAGPTEFLLGTTTWTSTLPQGGYATLNLSLRLKTGGLVASRNTVLYRSDGIAHAERADDANVAVGAPIVFFPEPGSLGLLAAAACLGLTRRRRER